MIFKKHIVSFVFLILASTNLVAVEKFEPLIDVFQREESVVNALYIVERCAALILQVSNDIGNRRDLAESTVLARQFEERAQDFIVFALTIREDMLQSNTAMTDSQNMMRLLSDRYSNLMDEEYVRSGETMSEELVMDLELCFSLL